MRCSTWSSVDSDLTAVEEWFHLVSVITVGVHKPKNGFCVCYFVLPSMLLRDFTVTWQFTLAFVVIALSMLTSSCTWLIFCSVNFDVVQFSVFPIIILLLIYPVIFIPYIRCQKEWVFRFCFKDPCKMEAGWNSTRNQNWSTSWHGAALLWWPDAVFWESVWCLEGCVCGSSHLVKSGTSSPSKLRPRKWFGCRTDEEPFP